MKGFKLLARLMGRQAGGNVPLLYARAVRRPLLVEPGLGEALIQGYLAAAAAGEGRTEGGDILQVEEGIAVIDVAGALVSHDTIGFCGETPTSYAAIGRALEAAIDDPAVQTVMLRLDSPGGEADGCFDLADQIYAARGQKKLVAVVDHMAYSAAYAIASACDEIWLSRTAGVGSVGVVTYHVDQTEFNAKSGIKVEYIHAGARKVDGSPHAPLSQEARGWMQAEIDRLYGMFAETVARNRGLTLERVQATEAGCFFAEGAIEAGLADKIGTFSTALVSASGGLARLEAEEGEEPEVAAPNVEPAPDPVAAATESHLAIMDACAQAGLPEMAADYIRAGSSPEAVIAALDLASQVKSICAAAGLDSMAESFIRDRTPLAAVSAAVITAVQAKDEAAIDNHVPPQLSTPAKQADSKSIYKKRQQAHRK